ncbi:hypothetical protein H009_06187 [Agrobacterium tumefaciens str. Cherry 2E-2-2]|nr:hypothetical protein H009_06187 [Agrobacterium tumefaciens str. Cherry 2E-2-2]
MVRVAPLNSCRTRYNMTRKTLPIPEENRSQQGPGDNDRLNTEEASAVKEQKVSTQTGRQANIKINTTHQGHQQDR